MTDYHTIVRAGSYEGDLETGLASTGLKIGRLTPIERATNLLIYDLSSPRYALLASTHDGEQQTSEGTPLRNKYLKGHNTLVAIASESKAKAEEIIRLIERQTGMTLEDSLPPAIIGLSTANATQTLKRMIESPEEFLKIHTQ